MGENKKPNQTKQNLPTFYIEDIGEIIEAAEICVHEYFMESLLCLFFVFVFLMIPCS